MRKILFATSECVPFVKTGGLADVCGALPKGFNKDEWDVRVVLPNYTCIPDHFRNNFKYITHLRLCQFLREHDAVESERNKLFRANRVKRV